MAKPTVVTVPTGFAWVVEEAIHAAVRRINEMKRDGPDWLAADEEGTTLVVVMRDAEPTLNRKAA